MSKKILSLDYGIKDFLNDLKDPLLNNLRGLRQIYKETTDEMISLYQNAVNELKQKEENFREQETKYKKHCELLEIAHSKQESDSGYNEEFNKLKQNFKAIQDDAINAHIKYNEELSNFHVAFEQFLNKYEQAEYLRESKMNQFFSVLAEAERKLTEQKRNLAHQIRTDFENALAEAESEKIIVPDGENGIDQIVEFKPKELPSEIAALVALDQ